MKSFGYAFPIGHYNTDFANAIVNAFANGKKTIVFKYTRYNVAACMKNVLDDVKHGCYNLKCKVIEVNKKPRI